MSYQLAIEFYKKAFGITAATEELSSSRQSGRHAPIAVTW